VREPRAEVGSFSGRSLPRASLYHDYKIYENSGNRFSNMGKDFFSTLNSTLGSTLSETRPADVALGLTAALVLGGVAKWALSSDDKQIGKKIPSPPGLPLLKNALDIPYEREWEVYEKWKRQYGTYMHILSYVASMSES
jgi:hypothetical protein